MRDAFLLLACLMSGLLCAQTVKPLDDAKLKRQQFEFRKNMPAYAEQLVADLTFPMAWGNSTTTDFNEWRQLAREKVFECMLTPPPPSDAPAKPLELPGDFEQREGYRAYRLSLPLSRYYDVPALLLVPDGEGPFPAVNVLHDHGAHLFIGKEKMIRPLATDDSQVRADADAWVASLYEGQYLGDFLAKHATLCSPPMLPFGASAGVRRVSTARLMMSLQAI